MKNLTLSIPDDLLAKGRQFAESKGTTLNQLVRDLLSKEVLGTSANMEEFWKSVDELELKKQGDWLKRDEANGQ